MPPVGVSYLLATESACVADKRVPFCQNSVPRGHILPLNSQNCVIEGEALLEEKSPQTSIVRSVERNPPNKQMGDTFVVSIFHHGWDFIRNSLGDFEYANGMVEKFEEMDLDMVNFGDMKKLFEGLDHLRMNLEFEFHLYWEHVINEPIMALNVRGANADNVGGVNGNNVAGTEYGNLARGVAQPINLESDSDSDSEVGSNGDNVEGAKNGFNKPPPPGYDESDYNNEA
ncbi:hypothetical protein PIB30_075660 [Stylosanthes scabra]|uniref:PB1-like domain-containing protein n=1 Tax=Stylosanthes scabra TaxID=79078 RepID=A0ABU6SQ73_9FABA|nr:hypothetical protein [Stylosanthes scabra]